MTAHLNRDAHLTVGHAVEIVGKVNQDLSVKVLMAVDMGKDRMFFSFRLSLDFCAAREFVGFGSEG